MRVIGCFSIKGGTGKSTATMALARELKARGLRVGLLDADLDSPYLVELGGIKGKVGLDKERKMVPVEYEGMPVLSFALWVPEEFGGATMHGAMHDRWIEDAFKYTVWGELDVLVVDCPAGSGEAFLTLKRVAGSDLLGLVAVAQPNVVSGLRRVFNTATYHGMRILGVIENMSGPVFGEGGVGAFCKEQQLMFFGSIPLDQRIRVANEAGKPEIPKDIAAPVERAADVVVRQIRGGVK